MKIKDFEQHINELILERGKDYFNGRKLSALRIEGNRYSVIAHGTDDYHVEAVVDAGGEIIDCWCDCPYEDGGICKHEAALFFVVRDYLAESSNHPNAQPKTPKEQPIEKLVKSMSKERLEDFLLTFANRFEDIESQIRFNAGSDEEKINEANEIIQSHIKQSRRNGFIEASKAGQALMGVSIVFEEARACDKLETGIALCLLGIEAVEKIDAIDDSYGFITDMLITGRESVEQLLDYHLESLSKQERKSVFRLMMKHMRKQWSYDLSFSGGLLMETLLPFCHDTVLRSEYEWFLDTLLSSISVGPSSYEVKYDIEVIEILKFQLIDLFDDIEKRNSFIDQHLHNSHLREIAINEAIADQKYDRTLSLIEDGKHLDKDSRGLVNQWDQLAFKVHKALNHPDEIRQLAQKFILDEQIEYYEPYLATYSAEQHDHAVDIILSQFEGRTYPSETYIKILIIEKKHEKLMALCEKCPKYIEQLYSHLMDSHKERVNACFQRWIWSATADANNRKAYRKVCRYIKTYRKAFGDAYLSLVDEMRKTFARRLAMLEELDGILGGLLA